VNCLCSSCCVVSKSCFYAGWLLLYVCVVVVPSAVLGVCHFVCSSNVETGRWCTCEYQTSLFCPVVSAAVLRHPTYLRKCWNYFAASKNAHISHPAIFAASAVCAPAAAVVLLAPQACLTTRSPALRRLTAQATSQQEPGMQQRLCGMEAWVI
jgi:hypothetical protein